MLGLQKLCNDSETDYKKDLQISFNYIIFTPASIKMRQKAKNGSNSTFILLLFYESAMLKFVPDL